jgi:hypothetical protein
VTFILLASPLDGTRRPLEDAVRSPLRTPPASARRSAGEPFPPRADTGVSSAPIPGYRGRIADRTPGGVGDPVPALADVGGRSTPHPVRRRKLVGLCRPVRAGVLRNWGGVHRSRLPLRSYRVGIAVAARRASRWRGAPTCPFLPIARPRLLGADTAGISPVAGEGGCLADSPPGPLCVAQPCSSIPGTSALGSSPSCSASSPSGASLPSAPSSDSGRAASSSSRSASETT